VVDLLGTAASDRGFRRSLAAQVVGWSRARIGQRVTAETSKLTAAKWCLCGLEGRKREHNLRRKIQTLLSVSMFGFYQWDRLAFDVGTTFTVTR
jgi:hypothetical protein